MGKFHKKKKKRGIRRKAVLLVVLTLLLTAEIGVAVYLGRNVEREDNSETVAAVTPETTQPAEMEAEAFVPDPMELEQGLRILRMDSYAGIFMEDGSNDIVSGVMMLVLENTSEQDLQLARIDVIYPDFTAQFEATNLPAGKSVVLLEKKRHSTVSEEYQCIEAKNVVFFKEEMDLCEDRLKLSGGNGFIQITNASDQDVAGDFYIYYKTVANNMYYGGITYRVRVEGGLAAGEIKNVAASRYTSENCEILMVSGVE